MVELNSSTVETTCRRQITKRRAIGFRIAAILFGLLPLLLCEVALRIANWTPASEVEDPYIGFSCRYPLFKLNNDHDRYQTAESRLEYFVSDSFGAKKSEIEFRIFVLGGSTVQGRPYSIETSFATWLRLSLGAADPNRIWEVVNCGGVSYASYRLVPIVYEVLRHEPDLIILYTGHNEFLESRTYEQISTTPQIVRDAHVLASNSRAYLFCRNSWIAASASHGLPAEVDARLDYASGLDSYHRDNQWRDAVAEDFRANLHQIVHVAAAAQIPVVLANPVCKLGDNAPFKTELPTAWSRKEREEFTHRWTLSKQLIASDPNKACKLLEELLTRDQQHAGVAFDLAVCREKLGQFEAAKTAYQLAKDYDVCPLRILTPMRKVIEDVSRSRELHVVDVHGAISKRSNHGIVDGQWMMDHVHPTIEGHQLIADLFMNQLIKQGFVYPAEGWKSVRDASYQTHLESLNYAYYERGRQRLEGLRTWTKGESHVHDD